jgi:hypothetical protein
MGCSTGTHVILRERLQALGKLCTELSTSDTPLTILDPNAHLLTLYYTFSVPPSLILTPSDTAHAILRPDR